MKKLKWLGLILLIVGIISLRLSLKQSKNDNSLNPLPITLEESVAQAVSPSGQGIFVIGGNDCTAAITNPVINGTWCLLSGPPSDIQLYNGTSFQSYIPSNQPADFGFNFISVPLSNLLVKYVALRTYTVPANFTAAGNAASSKCSANVAATGSAVFNIQHNGSNVATATFAPSGTTCSFSIQAGFTLIAGDTIGISAPSTVDATLSDISITLGTVRN